MVLEMPHELGPEAQIDPRPTLTVLVREVGAFAPDAGDEHHPQERPEALRIACARSKEPARFSVLSDAVDLECVVLGGDRWTEAKAQRCGAVVRRRPLFGACRHRAEDARGENGHGAGPPREACAHGGFSQYALPCSNAGGKLMATAGGTTNNRSPTFHTYARFG